VPTDRVWAAAGWKWVALLCWWEHGGLAVTQGLRESMGNAYCVTHVPSGTAVARNLPSAAVAVRVALRILPLATWTLTTAEMKESPGFDGESLRERLRAALAAATQEAAHE
jgi:hypothetical protein